MYGTLAPGSNPIILLSSGPGPKARRSKLEFEQDAAFRSYWERRLGTDFGLQYIGSWHSHHKLSLREPSSGDRATVQNYARQHHLLTLVEIIATHESSHETVLWPFVYNNAQTERPTMATFIMLSGHSPVRQKVDNINLAPFNIINGPKDDPVQSGDFDVFLCHSVKDKPEVKKIGEKLKEYGILPWLDEWELRPGLPWQRLLEEQIGQIKSVAVFIGKDGMGPWQYLELEAFLREFVSRGCPVIPVLLQNAPKKPELPIFLRGMTWVDFRIDNPDPMERLIWGITGKRKKV